MSKTTGAIFVPLVVALLVVLALGSCAYTTVSCWHRGGHVVKNIFDWPTCLEARR